MIANRRRASPIAAIGAARPGDDGAPGVGPVVSSAHLASGRLPGLSEVEYGLITTRRAGKEKLVSISDAGFDACQRYGQLRDKLLLDIAAESRLSEDRLSEAAALLRMLSGAYDQAARAAATF
ncbi:hypothetical protein [Paracoccus sp. (in: a-proteobacteria)]|uniref:hypothetical protein n=1 Tax=Paracoccus sp. TaxID=267 RepID=UPI00321F9098